MPPPEPAAPIIDAHTHLAPASPAFQEWAGRTGADPALPGLLREMDENHVERAVVIGHWKPQEGERDGPFANKTNNDLVTVLRAHRDRFRGLLTVNLDAEGPVDLYAVDAHLREPDFPGIKCFTGYEAFSPNDPRLEPLFDVLEHRDAVAVFHSGDTLSPSGQLRHAHPLAVDQVAVARPELKIVIAHAGQHWMADAGEVIGKNPNVWADISGWFVGRDTLPPRVGFLEHQFQSLVYWATGCDRLMFGSDWPLMRIRPYIEFVQGCAFLDDQEKQMILHDNAQRLYWDMAP